MTDVVLAVVLAVVGSLVVLGGVVALLFMGGSLAVVAYVLCLALGGSCIYAIGFLR
jgi:hypothetical protein